MNDLDALLAGILANPHEGLRWLVLADWLDDHGQPERAELLRLHRELLRTCTEPEAYPERTEIHERIMELMRAGATPCVPRMTLPLPGGVELPMVFIPPGSFRMGSITRELGHYPSERSHVVRFTKGLFLGVSPVTQSQWVSVMSENPSYYRGDTLPVDRVSWSSAVLFCARISRLTGHFFRLPTEAEWEYACRAGTTAPFYWGNKLNGAEANCDGNEPYGTETAGPSLGATTIVGRYANIAPHPWGLVDIVGNVLEWCSDLYDRLYYLHSPQEDPTGPDDGLERIVRGGSWINTGTECRSAYRNYRPPFIALNYHGFRVAYSHS